MRKLPVTPCCGQCCMYPAMTKLEYEVTLAALTTYKISHPSYTIDELLDWMDLIQGTIR